MINKETIKEEELSISKYIHLGNMILNIEYSETDGGYYISSTDLKDLSGKNLGEEISIEEYDKLIKGLQKFRDLIFKD